MKFTEEQSVQMALKVGCFIHYNHTQTEYMFSREKLTALVNLVADKAAEKYVNILADMEADLHRAIKQRDMWEKSHGEEKKNAERLKGLRELCGYVEDGSDTTVRIFQDDATRDWIVKAGANPQTQTRGIGSSLYSAIDNAISAQGD